MRCEVFWSENALRQLETIAQYLAQTSAVYAERIVDRILARTDQLAAFPESGHSVAKAPSDDIRELLEKPYRIIYLAQRARVDVLAVIHMSQLVVWPPE